MKKRIGYPWLEVLLWGMILNLLYPKKGIRRSDGNPFFSWVRNRLRIKMNPSEQSQLVATIRNDSFFPSYWEKVPNRMKLFSNCLGKDSQWEENFFPSAYFRQSVRKKAS